MNHPIKMGAIAAVATALWCSGTPINAATFQNVAALNTLVAETVGAAMGEPGGARKAIDPRLKLARCPVEPKVEGPVFGAAVIRCLPLGWRIRVPLLGDQGSRGFSASSKKPEILIRRGQSVMLLYKGNGFSLNRQMIADENGAMGDMIRVRKDHKSWRVLAEVSGSGQVVLPTP